MGLFGASPIQEHPIQLVTDLYWATGTLESRGDPHNYINQDDFDFLQIVDAQLRPWSFTGLPAKPTSQLIVPRATVQLLLFTEAETRADYRKAPQTAPLFLYYPLFIVRGEVPLYSEAETANFLDFWRSTFIPLINVRLHFLAEGGGTPPTQIDLVYTHRQHIQGYFEG